MQTGDYLTVIGAGILCAGNLYYIKNYEKGKEGAGKSVAAVAVLSAAVFLLSLFLRITQKEVFWIYHLKYLAFLALLCPVAWIDYKEHKIKNHLLLAGVGLRAVIFAAELFTDVGSAFQILAGEAILAAVLLAVCAVILLVMKNSIGAGDVKLFLLLPFFMDALTAQAIMISLLCSFAAAVGMLITRKKKRKDVMPFGPMALAGVYLTVLLA